MLNLCYSIGASGAKNILPLIAQDIQRLSNSVNVNWAAIQQAVQGSTTPQTPKATTPQALQAAAAIKTENFPLVPGAISNRTLEHLTETMTRPVRAIKGGDSSKPSLQ